MFHALNDLGGIKFTLENRAFRAINNVYELKHKLFRNENKKSILLEDLAMVMARGKRITIDEWEQQSIFSEAVVKVHEQKIYTTKMSLKIGELEEEIACNENEYNELCQSLTKANIIEKNAIHLADTMITITQWMQYDILAKIGPSYATRYELFDFVTQELDKKAPLSHHIKKISTKLKNQRDDLLRFAERVDKQIMDVAQRFSVQQSVVRELYELQGIHFEKGYRWIKEQKIRDKLGDNFHIVEAEIKKIIDNTTRASSVVENRNSRLRAFFDLRKSFGQKSLDLLQFFLNHETFMRSAHYERVGKSPAQLLSGKPHPHWLEMLGFTRFKQSIAQA